MAACSRVSSARCHPWTRSQVSRLFHATGDARQASPLSPPPLPAPLFSPTQAYLFISMQFSPRRCMGADDVDPYSGECVCARTCACGRGGRTSTWGARGADAGSGLLQKISPVELDFFSDLWSVVGTVWNARSSRAGCLCRRAGGEFLLLSAAPKTILPSWMWSRFESDVSTPARSISR